MLLHPSDRVQRSTARHALHACIMHCSPSYPVPMHCVPVPWRSHAPCTVLHRAPCPGVYAPHPAAPSRKSSWYSAPRNPLHQSPLARSIRHPFCISCLDLLAFCAHTTRISWAHFQRSLFSSLLIFFQPGLTRPCSEVVKQITYNS
jgi:hypothetical protein